MCICICCKQKVLNVGMWNVGGEDGEAVRWVSAALALSYILVRFPYDSPSPEIDPVILYSRTILEKQNQNRNWRVLSTFLPRYF